MTTTDDEERFIYEQLITARADVEQLRKEAQALQIKRNRADKFLAMTQQAALDYMLGNGCVATENFRILKKKVIDVHGEFPDEYARIKREPDKRKIMEELPEANWYSVKENTHVILVGEK